jgi:hypothetical protein
MCPMCLASAAWIMAAVGSAGGVTALIGNKIGHKIGRSAESSPNRKNAG